VKLSVVAVGLALFLTVGTARADDAATEAPATEAPATEAPATEPPVIEEPASDEPGTPGENAAAITPAPGVPAPEPARATTRARLSNPAPRSARVRELDDGRSRLDKQEDTVLGGKHWRIRTAQGAVHVWVPPGYERESAGTVVYVHGYWTDADGAWRGHDLARQFKNSRQNAVFIVPDAPSSNEERVQWPALTDLRRAVTRANIKLPDGPIIVMGHSGAFRTVMQWVDHRHVDQIILLDAMYAGERAFDEFIATGKRADHHKLIVVAASTASSSASFAKKYKFAVTRERVPDHSSGFTKRERGARLLYIRSQYEHMQIVTGAKVIPPLLRLTRLKWL
jgi:hypothetical protein